MTFPLSINPLEQLARLTPRPDTNVIGTYADRIAQPKTALHEVLGNIVRGAVPQALEQTPARWLPQMRRQALSHSLSAKLTNTLPPVIAANIRENQEALTGHIFNQLPSMGIQALEQLLQNPQKASESLKLLMGNLIFKGDQSMEQHFAQLVKLNEATVVTKIEEGFTELCQAIGHKGLIDSQLKALIGQEAKQWVGALPLAGTVAEKAGATYVPPIKAVIAATIDRHKTQLANVIKDDMPKVIVQSMKQETPAILWGPLRLTA